MDDLTTKCDICATRRPEPHGAEVSTNSSTQPSAEAEIIEHLVLYLQRRKAEIANERAAWLRSVGS